MREGEREQAMERSRRVEYEVHAKNVALIQRLNKLENKWKSQERFRQRRRQTCSTASCDDLFQTSPRTLMHSLQRRKSEFGRVENCSVAVGRFKGKKLFAGDGDSSGEERGSEWVNGVQERETIKEHDGSGGRRGDQQELPEEEKVVVAVEEEKVAAVVEVANAAEKRGGDGRRKKGGRRLFAKACLALVLVFIAVIFFYMNYCHDKNVQEFNLIPT